MSLSPQEQFKKFLEKSKEILILIEENPPADAVGSAWALHFFLEKMGLSPTVAFSNHLSAKFDFLPRPKKIQTEISGARDFVLSFDTSRNKIISARSEGIDGRFNIFVTPEKGSVDPRDFSFILAKFKYDLVVVIGASELDRLGRIYYENPDLFFEVPVVNIDSQSENDNFGQINLVEITASSTAEIIYDFFSDWHPEFFDQKIATCLLTGIIGATESFQKKNTTPKSLGIAAELMNRKADQQEIIRWLYKTQPLSLLKLWGRIMSKINWEKELQMVWAEISLEDFVQSRSKPEDIPAVIEKLKENQSESRVFAVIYNRSQNSFVSALGFRDRETAKKFQARLEGKMKMGLWETEIEAADISQAKKIILEKISEILQS